MIWLLLHLNVRFSFYIVHDAVLLNGLQTKKRGVPERAEEVQQHKGESERAYWKRENLGRNAQRDEMYISFIHTMENVEKAVKKNTTFEETKLRELRWPHF